MSTHVLQHLHQLRQLQLHHLQNWLLFRVMTLLFVLVLKHTQMHILLANVFMDQSLWMAMIVCTLALTMNPHMTPFQLQMAVVVV